MGATFFFFFFYFPPLFIQLFSPDKWRRDSVFSGLAANESHSHRASMSERWRRVDDKPGVTFENRERKRPWEHRIIERHALPVGFHPRPQATITSLASRIKWPWNWPSFRDFYSFCFVKSYRTRGTQWGPAESSRGTTCRRVAQDNTDEMFLAYNNNNISARDAQEVQGDHRIQSERQMQRWRAGAVREQRTCQTI